MSSAVATIIKSNKLLSKDNGVSEQSFAANLLFHLLDDEKNVHRVDEKIKAEAKIYNKRLLFCYILNKLWYCLASNYAKLAEYQIKQTMLHQICTISCLQLHKYKMRRERVRMRKKKVQMRALIRKFVKLYWFNWQHFIRRVGRRLNCFYYSHRE